MNQQIIWKQVNHPDILQGYLVSPEGYIKALNMKDEDAITKPSYHSTNGYDFMLLNNKDGNLQLFPLDDIIALTYIPIPESFKDKPIKVLHINGDTRDISLDNLQWVEDIEEWKWVKWKNILSNRYEVSSFGRVRNINGKLIKGSPDRDGYYRTSLITSNRTFLGVAIHQMVAYAFAPAYGSNNQIIVNHIDGSKINNYWKNLEWVTAKDNTNHAFSTSLCISGEDHKWSRLKENDVIKICESLIKHNGKVKNVLDDLKNDIPGLNRWIISVIKCKKTWKIISDRYFKYEDFIHENKVHITENDVLIICKLLLRFNMSINKTLNELHKRGYTYITKHHICIIKYKKSWKIFHVNIFNGGI